MAIRTFSNRTAVKQPQQFKVRESLAQWSQPAIADHFFVLFILLWLIPVILGMVVVAINYSSLPNQIPLFYSRVWGETQLAGKIFLFLPIGGTLLLGLFNLGLATSFHTKDKIFSYLLAGTASLVSALSFLAVVNITRLML